MLPDKETEKISLSLKNETETSEPTKEQETAALESKRSAYRIDLRSYVDRRQSLDRREAVRFEEDRRHFIRRSEDRRWRLS